LKVKVIEVSGGGTAGGGGQDINGAPSDTAEGGTSGSTFQQFKRQYILVARVLKAGIQVLGGIHCCR